MTHSFFRGVMITSLLGIGLNVACSSPTSPSVAAPAPLLTLTAVSPSRGLTGDEVAISGTGFGFGATVTFDGLDAKVKRVAAITATSSTVVIVAPFHPAGPVDVGLATNGATATLRGAFTYDVVSLTASPNRIRAGGELTTSWVAPDGRGCNGGGDWLAIYKVGAPDFTGASNGHSDLWYTHLCGVTSGTSTLSAPMEPGEYEFRYMVGDTAAARSNLVTVEPAASSRREGR